MGYKSPTNLVGVQKDFQEGYEEVENQPNVNHLQVARSWEVVAYAGKTRSNDMWGYDDEGINSPDKHCSQDKHYGEIDRDLKKY